MAPSSPSSHDSAPSVTGTAPDGAGAGLAAAVAAMREIRERCVWTQRIGHAELVPYLIEEAAEVVDAVETGTRDDLREELGDLLWQVLFHAEIASRDADDPWGIDEVAAELATKMVRRHPHVFAGEMARTPEEVLVLWNAAKAAEKHARTSVLDGIAPRMPSLARAQKVLGRGAGVGVEPQPATGARIASEDELGDVLLGLVALARDRGWDAERALRGRLRGLEGQIRAAETDDDRGGRAAAPDEG